MNQALIWSGMDFPLTKTTAAIKKIQTHGNAVIAINAPTSEQMIVSGWTIYRIAKSFGIIKIIFNGVVQWSERSRFT
jgi:hypothetical protein